jgi:hypothetical protein
VILQRFVLPVWFYYAIDNHWQKPVAPEIFKKSLEIKTNPQQRI